MGRRSAAFRRSRYLLGTSVTLATAFTLAGCYSPLVPGPTDGPSQPPTQQPRAAAPIDPIWDESASVTPTSNRDVDCSLVACVALTFDDGPRIYTPDVLDVLKKNSAPSTFYMLGNLVSTMPDTVQRVLDENNGIGNHSWGHADLATLSTEAVRKDIGDTNAAIRSITGFDPTNMRPPYGSFTDSTIVAIDMPIIYWTVDTEDWVAGRDPAATTAEASAHPQAGQIILMHDIQPNTLKILPKIIENLRMKGMTMVTVDQILKPLGEQKDVVYYSGATP